jgi:hypothetical protein
LGCAFSFAFFHSVLVVLLFSLFGEEGFLLGHVLLQIEIVNIFIALLFEYLVVGEAIFGDYLAFGAQELREEVLVGGEGRVQHLKFGVFAMAGDDCGHEGREFLEEGLVEG